MKSFIAFIFIAMLSFNVSADEHTNVGIPEGFYKSSVSGCFIEIKQLTNEIQFTMFSAFGEGDFKICGHLLSLDFLKNLGVTNYSRRLNKTIPLENCHNSACKLSFSVGQYYKHELFLKSIQERDLSLRHTVNGEVKDELTYTQTDVSMFRSTNPRVHSVLDFNKLFTFSDASSVANLRQKCISAYGQYFKEEKKKCEDEGKKKNLWNRCSMFASNSLEGVLTGTPPEGRFGMNVHEFERSCSFATRFAGGQAPYNIWILDYKI